MRARRPSRRQIAISVAVANGRALDTLPMNPLRMLRVVGFAEGLSFLFLLFVAVPLKHLAHIPGPVRICGGLHGGLLLLFLVSLLRATLEHEWKATTSLRLFVLSLIPFGFVGVDRFVSAEIARETATTTPGNA